MSKNQAILTVKAYSKAPFSQECIDDLYKSFDFTESEPSVSYKEETEKESEIDYLEAEVVFEYRPLIESKIIQNLENWKIDWGNITEIEFELFLPSKDTISVNFLSQGGQILQVKPKPSNKVSPQSSKREKNEKEISRLIYSLRNKDNKQEIRLHLDDDLEDRIPEPGWIQTTNVQQTVELLKTGKVVELSLDHDLGNDVLYGKGIHVIDYIIEQQELNGVLLWPENGIKLHTANPERKTMLASIERYASKHFKLKKTITGTGKPRIEFLKD